VTINFRLPGPTPLPPTVLAAMQREMIHHRGPEFKAFYTDVLQMAKAVHRTDGDVFIWPASGSAGWEIAIVNLLSPGDVVLATVCGAFGDRFARVGDAFGLNVLRLDVAWGQAITAEALERELASNPAIKAVFITHNETSTGVTNPLPELAAVARRHGALTIVDAVSSVGALPLETDGWELDVVLSGSQKAWMCPPGLVIVALGQRAWRAHERSRFPRFFWDITAAKKNAAVGMTSTTPPLTMLYAYDAALRSILAEGLETVWQRHRSLGALTRDAIRRLGLDLFADPVVASNTVTAVRPPAGVAVNDILQTLKRDHQVVMQNGQAPIADDIFRIGHMGWAHEPELHEALEALELTLQTLGVPRPLSAVV